jgi:putative PIN family toxin of toxin-antitoxin system
VRIVVDTNVLIAGLVADGLCRDIVKRRLPACEVVTSRFLLDELKEKLSEKFGADPKSLPLLELYEDQATVVEVVPLAQPVCRDPDDDLVLATALESKAEVVLTGDKDLLVLQEFQLIKVLSPRQFVEWMDLRS